MVRIAVAFVSILAVGCSRPDPAAERAAAAASTNAALAQLAQIERLNAQVDRLERDLDRAKRKPAAARVASAARVRTSKPARSQCYKDYCPCDPPQEGMDSVICDQLEAGMNVPVSTMIAGRGGREYRRQAAAIGF